MAIGHEENDWMESFTMTKVSIMWLSRVIYMGKGNWNMMLTNVIRESTMAVLLG